MIYKAYTIMNCLLDFHIATMDTIVHEYASFTDTIIHN